MSWRLLESEQSIACCVPGGHPPKVMTRRRAASGCTDRHARVLAALRWTAGSVRFHAFVVGARAVGWSRFGEQGQTVELWGWSLLAFAAGWAGAWYVLRAGQRKAIESALKKTVSLRDRADRLASEKVMLLGRLERHGDDLAAIKQQLLARERALYAITGTWPVQPPLKPEK